jgi:peptidoglycan hydrolase CwlO-like protein
VKYRAFAVTCLMLACACHFSVRVHNPNPAERIADSLYASAVVDLHNLASNAVLDTATMKLERYLGSPAKISHRGEAEAMLRLARDAQRLAHVEAALQQAKATSDDKAKEVAPAKKSDDEAVKEIQRLKEELAKANEELERIKKRLAAPKP